MESSARIGPEQYCLSGSVVAKVKPATESRPSPCVLAFLAHSTTGASPAKSAHHQPSVQLQDTFNLQSVPQIQPEVSSLACLPLKRTAKVHVPSLELELASWQRFIAAAKTV